MLDLDTQTLILYCCHRIRFITFFAKIFSKYIITIRIKLIVHLLHES